MLLITNIVVRILCGCSVIIHYNSWVERSVTVRGGQAHGHTHTYKRTLDTDTYTQRQTSMHGGVDGLTKR